MSEKSVFETLNSIGCSAHVEKKNGLSYLPWAWAWAEVKKKFPLASYCIYENKDGWNYHTDGRTCWVKTGVTIEGLENIEELPVMDYNNRSIPFEKVTSFDVNKAIQRSLTKACARHGLGLHVYAGEDLPEEAAQQAQTAHPKTAVETRRAVKTVRKKAAPKAAYVPMDNDTFWKVVKSFITGKVSKSGEDYRSVWVSQTNAGEEEIEMFNQKVREYCSVYGYELPSNL